jgi:hypothetical protein
VKVRGLCSNFGMWIEIVCFFGGMQVKAVREVMNQMLEAWKQIPDVSDEASPPPHSESSSKGMIFYFF